MTDEQVAQAVTALRRLAAVEGVLEWRVEVSTDTRKGRVIVENGLIEEARFKHFKTSPLHHEVGELMAGLSEVWLIGDYND